MDPARPAKHPVTALAGPYGHPVHPALVPLPIGAWLCSFGFDLASRVVSGAPWLVPASRWLIVIGVAGALLAGTAGALDLIAIPTGTPAFRTGLLHMTLNLTVTAAYAVNAALRTGEAPRVGLGLIALSAVSLAVLTVSGYLGGKLAYRYGVRVAAESVQAEGFTSGRHVRHAPAKR